MTGILAVQADAEGLVIVRQGAAPTRLDYGMDIREVKASAALFSAEPYEYYDLEVERNEVHKEFHGTGIIHAIRKILYHDVKRQRSCYFRKKSALKLKKQEVEIDVSEEGL